jgi:hypothetical protein
LRLDLLRGLCLLKMIFNHLPQTPVHAAQRWIGYVSAAEGFFFISGVVVGIVYGRRARTQGRSAARNKLLERALGLYLANLALVLLFLALEVSGWLQEGHFARLWTGGRFQWPLLFQLNQPYLLHVLTRYVVFLLLAPLALSWLRDGHTRRLLVAIGGLYLLGQGLGPNPHLPWLEASGWQAFPVLVWQLLFFGGMVCGFHRHELSRWWQRWGGDRLGWMALAASAAFALVKVGQEFGQLSLPPGFAAHWFDRTDLPIGRLVNLAVFFAAAYWVTDRCWRPLVRATGALLLPLGQASLYVFLVHILFVAAANAVLPHLAFDPRALPAALLAFETVLILSVWAMARYRVLFGFIPT